jgi:alpha-methylacyl-CoA racemase
MVDGSALLATMIHGFKAKGAWSDENRLANPPPSLSSHFYEVFETLDRKWVTIGAIEPQFYAELLSVIGLGEDERFKRQLDRSRWPELKEVLASVFRSKTRREWCELLEGTDTCFAPVLSLEEASAHPHNVSRQTFVEVDGVVQPAPAPRFSRTPAAIQCPPERSGARSTEVLRQWGLSEERIDTLKASGALA